MTKCYNIFVRFGIISKSCIVQNNQYIISKHLVNEKHRVDGHGCCVYSKGWGMYKIMTFHCFLVLVCEWPGVLLQITTTCVIGCNGMCKWGTWRKGGGRGWVIQLCKNTNIDCILTLGWRNYVDQCNAHGYSKQLMTIINNGDDMVRSWGGKRDIYDIIFWSLFECVCFGFEVN